MRVDSPVIPPRRPRPADEKKQQLPSYAMLCKRVKVHRDQSGTLEYLRYNWLDVHAVVNLIALKRPRGLLESQ